MSERRIHNKHTSPSVAKKHTSSDKFDAFLAKIKDLSIVNKSVTPSDSQTQSDDNTSKTIFDVLIEFSVGVLASLVATGIAKALTNLGYSVDLINKPLGTQQAELRIRIPDGKDCGDAGDDLTQVINQLPEENQPIIVNKECDKYSGVLSSGAEVWYIDD